MAAKQQLLDLYGGLLGIAPSAVGVDIRWKVGFEDRLQHQRRGCHADPIPHARDAQRPQFAVGFRYEHASDRLRSVVYDKISREDILAHAYAQCRSNKIITRLP